MVNFDPNVTQASAAVGNLQKIAPQAATNKDGFTKTANAVADLLTKTNDSQQNADLSIMDLLSGRNEDINSVVAQTAKADMSFKVLVGVRNKLIEAYKQTMNMPI